MQAVSSSTITTAQPAIGPVPIKRLQDREAAAIERLKEVERNKGVNVTREAQAIFDALYWMCVSTPLFPPPFRLGRNEADQPPPPEPTKPPIGAASPLSSSTPSPCIHRTAARTVARPRRGAMCFFVCAKWSRASAVRSAKRRPTISPARRRPWARAKADESERGRVRSWRDEGGTAVEESDRSQNRAMWVCSGCLLAHRGAVLVERQCPTLQFL